MYFLTTVRLREDQVDDQRPVGYFRTFKDAALCAKKNRCDIFEDGYYDYAIVIYIEPGLYPNTRQEQWYAFNREERIGYEIDEPVLIDKFGHNFSPYIIG